MCCSRVEHHSTRSPRSSPWNTLPAVLRNLAARDQSLPSSSISGLRHVVSVPVGLYRLASPSIVRRETSSNLRGDSSADSRSRSEPQSHRSSTTKFIFYDGSFDEDCLCTARGRSPRGRSSCGFTPFVASRFHPSQAPGRLSARRLRLRPTQSCGSSWRPQVEPAV